MANEMVNQEVNTLAVIEGLKLDRVQQSMNTIQQFQKVVQGSLVEGHDYGASFFGANKPSLLKPGAEKILMLLGLSSEYEIIEKIQDYEEGFFAYTIRCILTKGGQVITQGLGHCNSKEKKYTSDKQDIFMLGNTCLKMAKKRAQVDAALTVGSLSDIFTQDLEDMVQFEQSERIETLTIDDAENMKINFGKHRGKTIKEIYSTDEGYIRWLAERAKQEVVKKAASMVLNRAKKESSGKGSKVDGIEEVNEEELPWDEEVPF
ncbi:hypothetical protein NSA23_03705 [Anaerosalibacter massiliensis]|uniref:Exodeoxyribonuclease X-like C-terminal domain-containing protein n=1 Tax=Anaerosalibacter massiliensis TaxID=1347392 RepID=A0A9X2MFT3_9FIRM|nr:hypothetical protein [Anaerosalibacter massiliensis]MCR2043218.1 hypothetical protein [Anaerosalibacter massiliensis]